MTHSRLPRLWMSAGVLSLGMLSTGMVATSDTAHAQTRRPAASRTRTSKAASAKKDEAAKPSLIKNVFWQPNALKQGSDMLITAEFDRVPARVTGSFANRSITFFRSVDDPKVWTALAGVDLETNPGSYGLDVTAAFARGGTEKKTQQVDVAAGDFKPSSVEVPDNYVNPGDEEKKQIAKDEVLKKRAYDRMTRTPLWSGNFEKPVNAASTPSFGAERMLNEEKTSTHRGTDFEAKEGTAVVASNAGTVVLASEMFYEGNCVIIDHGLGFFTIYMHLKQIDVKVNEKVKKGEKLGLSGATGRVTGPHMHFGVRWNGAYLDPVQLLSMTLPQTTVKTTVTDRKSTVKRSAKNR